MIMLSAAAETAHFLMTWLSPHDALQSIAFRRVPPSFSRLLG
jgi:hypothetical protein